MVKTYVYNHNVLKQIHKCKLSISFFLQGLKYDMIQEIKTVSILSALQEIGYL